MMNGEVTQLCPHIQGLTSYVPADIFYSTCVVMMPVCDDDLLDAGAELLQCLFQAADVFRHSRFPRVYQHPSGI